MYNHLIYVVFFTKGFVRAGGRHLTLVEILDFSGKQTQKGVVIRVVWCLQMFTHLSYLN